MLPIVVAYLIGRAVAMLRKETTQMITFAVCIHISEPETIGTFSFFRCL